MHCDYSAPGFETTYTYTGSDLGCNWQPQQTTFRLWAPTAKAAWVNLYRSGDETADDMIERTAMTPGENGTWLTKKQGDLHGVYYTYTVQFADGAAATACDPYAVTTGVNGARAMVLNTAVTDPDGWAQDAPPHAGKAPTDAVIYELHIRDLSMDENAGITHKGKYLGLAETGTKSPAGLPTGLDHIKALGVTHIHLLPVYDYGSVDERRLHVPQFNWGYDPVNYNAPEGSYATDPFDGAVRVRELKQTIKALHENGLSVIMDVVYNHVFDADSFCFNKLVPQYFSRVAADGSYSSGSECGNDTASERTMVRKFIVDSVCHWADEYHVDGFRFDLVGLLDTDTINALVAAVHAKHPHVIFYGEGWDMPTHLTKPDVQLAIQPNSHLTPGFGYFSDTLRDGLRGSVFINEEQGYVSGADDRTQDVACSFTAAPPWCSDPTRIVNYASCHDNMTLFDRLTASTPDATVADRIKMNKLAAAIVLTSQGIPFMQAGEELLRTKPLAGGGFDHNSYKSPDAVNCIKWGDLADPIHRDVLAYYKGLIAFRADNPALRMLTAADIAAHITPLPDLPQKVLGFVIAPGARGQQNTLLALFNPTAAPVSLPLPQGEWQVYISGEKAGTTPQGSVCGFATVDSISALILVK